MPTYNVNHAYRSFRDGVQYGPYEPGSTVELDATDAEWINRDSPGALIAAGTKRAEVPVPDAEAEPTQAKPPAANRQAKGGRNRAA